MPGTLYVVATPIGNLGDITARAVEILRSSSVVASEDTRTTGNLLRRHGITTPLVAFFQHSGPRRRAEIVARLKAGESVALVSEAGTPGISDPGADLVAAAHAEGIPVRALPGPSSAAAAASVSGFDVDRFVFEGFLPRRPGKRRRILKELASQERTLVFFEAPHRIARTLEAMRSELGDRRIVLCRELTKIHEEVRPTRISAALESFASRPPRGEFVIVVEGAARARGRRGDPGREEE